jgi:hypothetical protein
MNIKIVKTILACTLALSCASAYTKNTVASSPRETWITVFVHGIMSIKPHLKASNVLKFMCDDVCNTLYSKTVELMRLDRHFFKNQAMQGFGFIKIDPTLVKRGYSPGAIADLLNDVTLWSEPEKTFDNHYYTYGWTGLLSPSQRYEDAKGLFLGLEKLVAEFKAQGYDPKIRVIGYSHGGNVVLNLGAVHQKVRPNSDLRIDETILLGMPVQKETAHYVTDPVFKKVYHIYSGGDRVQNLDFFSFKRFFSYKKFTKGRKGELPKNLVQIKLKLTRLSQKAHKNPERIALSQDLSRPEIVSGHSHLLRDSSPGHAELWFFAWPYVHYRETFALHPLPTVVLLPYIIKNVRMIEDITNPSKPIIVDIRPENGVIMLRRFKGKEVIVSDFIPPYVFNQMREKAYRYKPDSYTIEEYDRHVTMAVEKAKEIYRTEWCKNPVNVRRRKKQCSLCITQTSSAKERVKEKRCALKKARTEINCPVK